VNPPWPEPGEVHLWRGWLDQPPSRVAELEGSLSAEERERAARLLRPRDRERAIVSRGLLRSVLSRYLGVEPKDIPLRATPYGRPETPGGPAFNVSHSDGLWLLAVAAGGQLGLDVERLREQDVAQMAAWFCAPAEIAALQRLPDAQRLTGAYTAWTRKEAYLKATGHGISRGLHHFDVTLTPGEPARLLADRLDPDAPHRWTLAELAPGTGYSGALVAPAPLGTVVVRDVAELP
jgi:4'-phosphopantetheinyl transferase